MEDMMLSSHMHAVDRSNVAVSTLVEWYLGRNPPPEEAAFRMPRLKQKDPHRLDSGCLQRDQVAYQSH